MGHETDPPAGDDPSGRDRHIQRIRAARGSAVVTVLHGDMHIDGSAPPHHLTPWPPGSDTPSAPPPLLATLRDRLDTTPVGLSVLLLQGGTADDRTALLHRLAAVAPDLGWTVAAAARTPGPRADLTGTANLLTVVEDAGSWPSDALLLLLSDPLLLLPHRTCALLTADRPGTWWPTLRHRLTKAGLRALSALRV